MTAMHLALITGQSNADVYLKNAVHNTMYNGGYPDRGTAQWNQGGQPISNWISESGNTQGHFDLSTGPFDTLIADTKAAGDTIGSLSILWAQGERETIENKTAPSNATANNYGVKLPLLMRAFQRRYLIAEGVIPTIGILQTTYDQTHANWDPDQLIALNVVQSVQASVAASMPNVHLIKTDDLSPRIDEVHWPDWTGGTGPQKTIAERFVALIQPIQSTPYHAQLVGIDHG